MRWRKSRGDITQNFHGGNQLSIDAYMSVRKDKHLLRARVVEYIKSQGLYGATCDELEAELNLPHQTASARVTEAKAKGEIVDSGLRRKTRSGRNAAVLIGATTSEEHARWAAEQAAQDEYEAQAVAEAQSEALSHE